MSAAEVLLSRPVLTLNKRWVPIHTCSVKEAIGLVAKGSAKIIEPGTFETHDLMTWNDVSRAKATIGEGMIRSVHLAIQAPEVILLTAYEGLAERGVIFSRKNLFKRDRYTCQYCGAQPGPAELTMDHVVPRSQGGVSSWVNCVLACVSCNKKKGDKSCDKAKMWPRKAPKKPSWKVLMQVNPRIRRESWEAFLSRAYWEVELDA